MIQVILINIKQKNPVWVSKTIERETRGKAMGTNTAEYILVHLGGKQFVIFRLIPTYK